MVSQDGASDGRTPVPALLPCHVPGPDGPWEEVQERIERTGRAVVHTTWGQWLTAALLDPALRTLLGRDWPRYRQHPAPAGRLILAVSRTVLKHTAAQVLQVPPGRLDLAYLPGGRPVLRGLGADLQVSLAHTDELIVVGVSRVGPLGVDAEPAGRRISLPALCEHVCTAQEARLIEALPEQERTRTFLRLWTLKEAYAKALGHGMRRRFTAIGFEWDTAGRARLAGDTAGRWAFATHLVDGRYLVSEAYRHDEAEAETGAGAGAGDETGAGDEGHHRGRAHHRAAAPPQPQGPRAPFAQDAPDRPPVVPPQGPRPQRPRAPFVQDAPDGPDGPAAVPPQGPRPQGPRAPFAQDAPDGPPVVPPQGPRPQGPRAPFAQDAPDGPPVVPPQGPRPQRPRAPFVQDAPDGPDGPAAVPPQGPRAPVVKDAPDAPDAPSGPSGVRASYGGRVLDFSQRRGGPPR